mgnify:CR=1 FL=1
MQMMRGVVHSPSVAECDRSDHGVESGFPKMRAIVSSLSDLLCRHGRRKNLPQRHMSRRIGIAERISAKWPARVSDIPPSSVPVPANCRLGAGI